MFVLHVDLTIEPTSRETLEKTYHEIFAPAVSSQEGFSSVNLLRPPGNKGKYRLSIAFEREAWQKRWVASDLHQRVWPLMELQCARYSVKTYHTVEFAA